MTEFGIPLPPDDLVMVWDKDANPWTLAHPEPRDRGGVWMEASKATAADRLRWPSLVAECGPLTDFEPRCEAYTTVEDKGHFRCLLAPGHAGHHKLPETCWSAPS